MDELLTKFLKYLELKKRPSIMNVAMDLDLKDYEVFGLLEMLKQYGYYFQVIDNKIVKLKTQIQGNIYQVPNNLDHLKLLMISDTHLGSKYDRLDILKYLYQEAERRKANYILHSGDLTDGKSNRDEQVYQLKEHSYTGQRDYVVENYPKSEIPTYYIAGNHDLWWIKQCGADICQDIANKREDLTYLGSDCEDLKIGKLKIRLYHGKGGSAYAKSYKLQKYLDSIPPEERPHILQTGHIHQAFYLKEGNTHCFQTSCLQDLTPFERSMGFRNDKSAWWVTVRFDDNGNVFSVQQELESFNDKTKRKKR